PGVAFGIYNSPMLLAVGFLVGTASVVVWFIGALIGNFGIIVGGSGLGLWDIATGQGITSSLGMGVMMGCGIGVILKNILPKAIQMIKNGATSGSATFELTATGARKSDASTQAKRRRMRLTAGLIAGGIAAVALLICIGLGLGPLPSIIIVLFAWITTAMSAQSVGQTGIDPMEIF
ncbi:MAG: peptide transporter, partial [Raoultibacter sp.]